ncbi:MAG TPA: tetratricopeptide repeat protein [Desulfobacteraceae bacterium]|nr:tetratricopeptide repeat protein [Desulfobacteraceae bacterium]
MKHVRNLAVAGCTVLLLCQCASKNEIRDLNYQIRAVNQKVEDVRGTTVDQMQKRQASSVSRIDEVQNEVVQLRSAIDERAHQENQFREQTRESTAGLQSMIESMRTENDSRLKLLEDRVSQLERNLDQMSEARIRDAEERAREAARRAEEARRRTAAASAAAPGPGAQVAVKPEGRKVKVDAGTKVEAAVPEAKPAPVAEPAAPAVASVPPPAESAAPAAPSAADPLAEAMDLYNNQRYAEAYKAFEQILARNPRGDEAAETLFYMGESLFARGEFDLAILDYQKVISNHAGHKRTPTALLKQGMSFEKLTDHETAKIIYKKLIAEYPDSSDAAKAEQQIQSLQ